MQNLVTKMRQIQLSPRVTLNSALFEGLGKQLLNACAVELYNKGRIAR